VRPHDQRSDPTDDTSEWARELQFAHWRTLDSVAKLRIVSEQSLALHRLSLVGLAARYPEDRPEELALKAHALRLGRDVLGIVRSLGPALDPMPRPRLPAHLGERIRGQGPAGAGARGWLTLVARLMRRLALTHAVPRGTRAGSRR